MPLIEGIGDDFLHALICLLFIGIISLAWLSTYVNYGHLSTTVFVAEGQTFRRNEERASPSPSLNSPLSSADETFTDIESSDIDEQTSDYQIPEQPVRVTIKFLNETQKTISANVNDTISKIKRLYFADELSNNKIIRFIYQGQELHDSETLHTYHIRDQTIIHCQITTRRHSTSDINSDGYDTSSFLDLSPVNISFHIILFLTIILASIWYLRLKYRVLFTPISTIILILITVLFLIFTYGPIFSSRRQIFQVHYD